MNVDRGLSGYPVKADGLGMVFWTVSGPPPAASNSPPARRLSHATLFLCPRTPSGGKARLFGYVDLHHACVMDGQRDRPKA